MRSSIVFLTFLIALTVAAVAAPRENATTPSVHTLSVEAETKAEMARYSLKAYGNRDATNRVKALLYTPKPVGMNALPMVVYLPEKGELGELEAQFRQRTSMGSVLIDTKQQ